MPRAEEASLICFRVEEMWPYLLGLKKGERRDADSVIILRVGANRACCVLRKQLLP